MIISVVFLQEGSGKVLTARFGLLFEPLSALDPLCFLEAVLESKVTLGLGQ